MTRSGGHLLADQLALHGASLAFCVPGESYLPLLDGLYDRRDQIRLVTCRHEASAANAAEAYGKLTGSPGICMVTRGPGATHAATGIHTAMQDSTPLIVLVGQVPTSHRGREAFQELDHERLFAPMCKWACEISDARRIPELTARAFATSTSGRPGPVILSLPEDILSTPTDVADARRYRPVEPVPGAEAMAELSRLLAVAERPFVIVGGSPWDAESSRRLRVWLEAKGLPAGASFRRQDIVDNRSPCYAGHVGLAINPKLAQRIADADLLIALGTRLSEIETQGYTLPAAPLPKPILVHIHPDPNELGRVYEPTLAIAAGMSAFTEALSGVEPPDPSRWTRWRESARADYEADAVAPRPEGGAVDLATVVAQLRDALPDDAIVTNGAGNYTIWLHRFFEYRRFGTQLGPQSGAMGYGIPAALAAALLHPDRVVVAFAGDGCFQMSGHELATAVQERVPIIVLVANNRMLATIRMHQERRFPGRMIGTDLVNPDFVALGEAYGAYAERVEHTDDFLAAFERARTARRPALIELVTDPDALTPRVSLSHTRAQERGAA